MCQDVGAEFISAFLYFVFSFCWHGCVKPRQRGALLDCIKIAGKTDMFQSVATIYVDEVSEPVIKEKHLRLV